MARDSAGYYCPDCHHSITNFAHGVIADFLKQKGDWPPWSVVKAVHESGEDLLQKIAVRLDQLDRAIRDTRDRDERRKLQEEQATLL